MHILAKYNKQKIIFMKNLTNLRGKGTNLSKEAMQKVGGGYSWLYCTWQFLVGNIPGGSSFDDCRAMRD